MAGDYCSVGEEDLVHAETNDAYAANGEQRDDTTIAPLHVDEVVSSKMAEEEREGEQCSLRDTTVHPTEVPKGYTRSQPR